MTTYDGISYETWVEKLNETEGWPSRHLMCAFAMMGIPRKFLDVGCGTGETVKTAYKFCKSSWGIDQLVLEDFMMDSNDLPAEMHKLVSYSQIGVKHHNLVEYIKLSEFDMVYCIEVAEHLDQSSHATLCDTLVDNLAKDGFLIFSAAFPNQGGMGHVSERPSKYWQDQFTLRKLGYRKDMTVQLALLWSNINSPLYWLPANVMVFEK